MEYKKLNVVAAFKVPWFTIENSLRPDVRGHVCTMVLLGAHREILFRVQAAVARDSFAPLDITFEIAEFGFIALLDAIFDAEPHIEGLGTRLRASHLLRNWARSSGAKSLTFDALRKANQARVGLFKNAKGDVVHNQTGSDWTPAQWFQAFAGEVGEYANIRKKFERGDITHEEFLVLGGKELADAQCYLDLLANSVGIDLGAVTTAKFNEVSHKVGAGVFLNNDDTVTIAGNEEG